MSLVRQVIFPTQALRSIFKYRQALYRLLARNLTQETRGSILGVGWLLLQPAFQMIIYTLVFGFILKVRFDVGDDATTFALYLMCGLLPYDAFQQALLRSSDSLSANRNMLIQSAFPGALLPLVSVGSGLVTESLGLGILLLAIIVLKGDLSIFVFLLPVLVVVRFLLTLGFSWVVSVLRVFFRDLGQLLSVLLSLGFFATPIIYPARLVPDGLKWVYEYNPFFYLVEAYRAILLRGELPDGGFWCLALGSVLIALMGLGFFNRSLERAKDFL